MRGQRIAKRVDHFALGDAPCGNLPQFLDAEAVSLRVVGIFEAEVLNERFGAIAARALGENRDLRMKIVAGLEVRLGLTLLVDAFVVGTDADHVLAESVVVEQQFRAGKSGEDGDSGFLDLRRQPLHKLVDRDDVVAVIA